MTRSEEDVTGVVGALVTILTVQPIAAYETLLGEVFVDEDDVDLTF